MDVKFQNEETNHSYLLRFEMALLELRQLSIDVSFFISHDAFLSESY